MWAYFFCQPISFLLGHPHQFLSKGVDLPLGGSFFWVNHGFLIEGTFFEVDEICGGPSPSSWAVLRIVPYLPTFKACVISSAGHSLGDAVSCVSSLPSPLVWGPGATKVHRNRSVVERRRSSGRINWWGPISNGVSVRRSVRWGPASHGLLRVLEELLGWLSTLLGCSPVSGI